jgi:hypothetical protein
MEAHHVAASPRVLARTGGLLYLIIIVGGIVGEVFVRGSLIVAGDATATAAKIMASESLWRVHIANELFMLICTTVLALILYLLLQPVSRVLALLAVLFNLVSIALEAGNELNLLATLRLLGDAAYLKVLDPAQLHALAYLPLLAYAYGFGVGLIFFGCECLVLGYLIFRSGYLPKGIGALMMIAGVCYLTNSFAMILAPALAHRLVPAILLPALVGEASFCLWLLVKGVNIERWKTQATAPPTRRAAATA